MKHPENMPSNLKSSPITEAEIAKQTVGLDVEQARRQWEVTLATISPEEIAILGLLLTKTTTEKEE